jgi:chromosome partitioning protein
MVGLMRSVLLAEDLVLVPAHSSPLHGWASGEMLKLIAEAQIFRPRLIARFVLNRCGARTLIARTLRSSSPNTILRRSPRLSASASSSRRTHGFVSELDCSGLAALPRSRGSGDERRAQEGVRASPNRRRSLGAHAGD